MADFERERMHILEMIEKGEISATEGLALLNALAESQEPETEPIPPDLPEVPAVPDMPDSGSGAWEPVESEGVPEAPAVVPMPPVPPTPVYPPEPINELDELEALAELEDLPESDDLAELEELYELEEPEKPEAPASSESVFFEPPAPARAEGQSRQEEAPSGSPFDQEQTIRKWRGFWQIPLWIGLVITILGGLWMYQAYQASGVGFWFACAWFPFLIGVGFMAFAWASRKMRWLHVRIHQKPGERPQNIAISLPLPLRLSAWAVRTFGHRIPNIEGRGIDEMILALEHTSPETPFFVDVDEGDGEHVQVFIG